MTIKRRNIALCIIFSLITCGIYGIYWFIKMTNESNQVAKSTTASGGLAFLFTLLTMGIYSFYWSYKMGVKMDEVNGGSSSGVVYLLLNLFGLGIITYCLIQSELNKVANA